MTTATKSHTTAKATKRKEAAEALHADLTAQVEQLRNTDQWSRYLDFLQSFHSYSINNTLLIMRQLPTASQVTGYRKWQAIGRQVRKGEKALRIFGYSSKKITVEDQATGEDVKQKITTYPILFIFDISQTEPIDGVEQVSQIIHPLHGTDDAGIGAAVAEWLTARGWSVEIEAIAGTANGYTQGTTGRVVIDANLSDAQHAKTMIHEASHVILHHDEDKAVSVDYAGHRGLCETEAESVAYVVAGLLGLDTSDYSVGYVAGWSECDAELIKSTAANVLRAAHILADALDPHDDTAATDDTVTPEGRD